MSKIIQKYELKMFQVGQNFKMKSILNTVDKIVNFHVSCLKFIHAIS